MVPENSIVEWQTVPWDNRRVGRVQERWSVNPSFLIIYDHDNVRCVVPEYRVTVISEVAYPGWVELV